MISEHAPEPLPGPALRAALAVIRDAPLRDLPPVTDARLAVTMTRSQSGWKGAAAVLAMAERRKPAEPKAKRNTLDRAECRRLHAGGQTTDQLAARYGVTPRQVNRILAATGANRRGNPAIVDTEFRARFAAVGPHELARQLGQKTFSVTRRAKRLGLLQALVAAGMPPLASLEVGR